MKKFIPRADGVFTEITVTDSSEQVTPDLVNHPPHYQSTSGVEAIDVIEAFELTYHLGNCVKYVLRAGKKDPTKRLEDLQKARWYLTRAIEKGL